MLRNLVFAFLFFPTSLFAMPPLEGFYSVSQDSLVENGYLNCQASQGVEIYSEEAKIMVSGLTHSPIEFRDVNKGAIGIPGPLVGFSQRRTTLVELDEETVLLKSEHRDCEPLLSKIGCFAKKWRTTAQVIVSFAKAGTIAELTYQPFDHVTKEVCGLIKAEN